MTDRRRRDHRCSLVAEFDTMAARSTNDNCDVELGDITV
jgi:hypothetical protein